MIEIQDITNHLLIQCPKCKQYGFVEKWGMKKCLFEGCGNEFMVEYQPELLLEEAKKLKLSYEDLLKSKIILKPTKFNLQKLPCGGWIQVPQN